MKMLKKISAIWLVCLMLAIGTLSASAAEVTSVRMDKEPTKNVYREGEAFDPSGMILTIVYADGTTAVADIFQYNYTPAGALSRSDRTVSIFCMGKKLTLSITVTGPDGVVETAAETVATQTPVTEAITGSESEVPTNAPAQKEPADATGKEVRADRQGQNWNFLHWSVTIIFIFAVAVVLVAYYRRNFGAKR